MKRFYTVLSIIIIFFTNFSEGVETRIEKKTIEKIQTIKFGVFSPGFYGLAPLYVSIENGYLKEEAIKVDFIQLSDPQLTLAIANGQIEAGVGSLPNPVYAIAKGLPIKLVAAANVIPPNRLYENILIRKGSDIRKIEDLRGKKISVGSKRGWPGIMMAYYFKRHGISLADSTFVEGIPLPQQKEAFEMGQIDAAYGGEPFVTMIIKAGVAEYLPIKEPWSGVNNFICFNNDYLNKKPDVVKRFLKAYVRGINYALEHETETRRIIAKFARLSEEIALQMKLGDWKRTWDKFGRIDVQGLKEFEQLMLTLGFLEKQSRVENNVDQSFLPK